MLELSLRRVARRQGYTIGRLTAGGETLCDTLEDADRGLSQAMGADGVARLKVKGATAIPTGRYRVTLDVVSPRFKARSWARPYGGRVPRLLGVPGFEGVLIHPGNTDADTDGCILVGRNTAVGRVTESVATYHKVMALLEAHRSEDIWVTIE